MIIIVPISNYNGAYEIDQYGTVYSRKNNRWGLLETGKPMKTHISKNGYVYVDLYKNSKRKRFFIHRLVAQHFLTETAKCVNHKDGVKTNNFVGNLEWTTHSENLLHAYETGLR